jgi:hypothetical protein
VRVETVERILLLVLALAGIAAAPVGRPNADEGWYLHAGRRALAGHVPYRDFAFTQPPVAAYAYGAVQAVVPGPRVRLGRFTSLAFLLGAAWFARGLARRAGGEWAGALALAALAASPDFLYFGTLVKTYAPSAFLLALAACWAWDERPGARTWAPLPAGLAAATRLSLAPAALIVLAAATRARGGAQPANPARAMLALLVGLAPLLITMAEPRAFVDQAIAFHWRPAGVLAAQGVADAGDGGGAVDAAPGAGAPGAAAGVMAQLVEMGRMHAGLAVCAAVGCALLAWRARADAAWLLALVLAAFLPQLLPPAHLAEYATPAVPLIAALAAAGLVRAPGPRALRIALACAALAAVAFAGARRIEACYGFRDRDVRAHAWDPVRSIEEAARAVRAHSAPGDTLLTLSTIVAVEARRAVPAGLDVAHFSEGVRRDSPAWPPDGARRFALLFVEEGAPPAIPGALAPRAGGAIPPGAELLATFPGFGQWQREARLYRLRATRPPDGGPAAAAEAGEI